MARLSVKTLFKPVFGRRKAPGIVGLEVTSDGISLACARSNRSAVDSVVMLSDDASTMPRPRVLAEYVEANELQGYQCNLVLDQSDYQLLLVDAPDVSLEELKEAMRWRIKDLISLPLDRAAMEVFLLPSDGVRGGKKMVYVVATDRDKLKELVSMVNGSGLELASIDIRELALRNLAGLKDDQDEGGRGIAIARILEGQGSVSIYRKDNLYLSRQFQVGYGGGLLDDIPVDGLVLEIQRSLDYFERQMGQAPPSCLYLCGENISEDKITEDIVRSLPIPVKHLKVHEELELDEEVDESLVQLCIGALGALRRDGEAA